MIKNTNSQQKKKRNLIFGSVYVALAVFIVAMSKTITVPLTLGFLTKDELAAPASSAPANQLLFDLRLSYLISGWLILLGVIHLLLATKWKTKSDKAVADRQNYFRWVLSTFSLCLALTLSALISGVTDINLLILISGSVFSGMVLAFQKEKIYAETKKANHMLFVLQIVALILAVLPTVSYQLGTVIWGQLGAQSMYLTLFVTGLMLLANIVFQLNYYKKRGNWSNYNFYEDKFAVFNFLGGLSVTLILFFGLLG